MAEAQEYLPDFVLRDLKAEPSDKSDGASPRSEGTKGRSRSSIKFMRPSEQERRERAIMQSANLVHKADMRARQSRKAAILAIGVAIIAFISLFCVVFLANEVSKEMTPSNNDHELRTRTGELIRVGQAISFSTIFDLPSFSTETLANLEKVTILLSHAPTSRPSGGASQTSQPLGTTLHIVSAVKVLGGNACTLFGASGAKLTIDSNARTAFAIVDGKHYLVRDAEGTSARQRRLARRGGVRLLSAEEFFTPEHGFDATGARRLSSASAIKGYAEFAISAAAGLLDYANAQSDKQYTSIYLRGTAYMLGGDGSGSMQAEVYYSALDPNASAIFLQQVGGTKMLINASGAGVMYIFSATGALTNCSDSMPEEMYPTDALSEVTVKAVNETLTLVAQEETLGDAVFEVDYYELDPPVIPSVFVQPSGDECTATLEIPPPPPPATPHVNPTDVNASIEGLIQTALNTTNASISGRRLKDLMAEGARLWSARDEEQSLQDTAEYLRAKHARLLSWASSTLGATSNSLWHSSWGAYSGYSTDGHWTDWVECSAGNANAQFHYMCDWRGCNMNLAFAGSDDIKDWLQNTEIWAGATGIHAKGFYDYQNSLKSCVQYHRELLKSWGIPLEYVVGHSLGGAAAVIYSDIHGAARRGVVTFGAPKSHLASATVAGWRFFHRDDPVPSNLCFLGCPLAFHRHVVSNVRENYDELVCWNERVESREREKRKECASTWWKFWCWFEYVWVTVVEWVRSCRWEKKVRTISNTNFAYDYWSLLYSIYGAVAKHGSYGEYPSLRLT